MNNSNKNSMIDNIPRLQWACRRGMLELDLILGKFLREAYPSASIEDKHRFIALLECTDPELFSWLMGKTQPQDKDFIIIVDKIRQHAHSGV